MEKEVLIACNVGDLSWLKASLAESEKTVNEIVNNEGLTPLHLAAYQRNILLLRYLLEDCKDVDINCLTVHTADTPLHLVLMTSSCRTTDNQTSIINCVQLLLSKGAHCNKRNSKGETALHLAAKVGIAFVVRQLLDHGADFTLKDERNQTPHNIACLHGNHECARLLRALHWAREKDSLTKTKVQAERENKRQRVLCKTIQKELRKQEAENAYDEWLNRNRFTPPPPFHSPVPRSTARLSCGTCSTTQMSNTTVQCSHSGNEPKITKIQISLNQAEHNIGRVGKPHKLYPYSNYPPKEYRCHAKTDIQVAASRGRRPYSCTTNHRSSKRVISHVRIKSAPTRINLATGRHGGGRHRGKTPHTINDIHRPNNDSHIQTETVQASLDINNGIKEKETDNITEEVLHDKEEEDDDDEGSSTSITFHDVGQENDLQSITRPAVTSTEGTATASSINPVEFLRILSELSSRRTYSRSHSHGRHRPAASYRYDRRFSLGSIPEGEIVTNYNKIEGSQVFDDDLLQSLLPFAFESCHFEGTEESQEESTSPAPDSPAPSRPDTPSVRLAWDSNSRPQTPSLHDKSQTSNSSTKSSRSSLSTSKVSSVESPIIQGKAPLQTSVFEFGGNISYTRHQN